MVTRRRFLQDLAAGGSVGVVLSGSVGIPVLAADSNDKVVEDITIRYLGPDDLRVVGDDATILGTMFGTDGLRVAVSYFWEGNKEVTIETQASFFDSRNKLITETEKVEMEMGEYERDVHLNLRTDTTIEDINVKHMRGGQIIIGAQIKQN